MKGLQVKGLLFFSLLADILAGDSVLVGRLQLVGADYFDEGKHYAFCALQQNGKDLIALDNVPRNRCHSGTEVELEATVIDAVNVAKSSLHHSMDPFQLAHGIVTKIISANGVSISDPITIGGFNGRNIKSQLDQMNAIASRRRRLAMSSGRSDLLIVRIKLADDTSVDSYCNDACALSNGWGTNSARTSYAQSSYGQLDVSASTGMVKTVTLTTTTSTYSGCNFDKLGNDAVAALDISTFGFDVISFIMPFNIAGCGFGGVAYVGGTRSWVRYGTPGVMVHELGHSYGAIHAGTDPNNDGVQDTEYGDYSCVMGSPSSLVTMNAVHRYNLGWVRSTAASTFQCPVRNDCMQIFTIADTQENPSSSTSNGRYTIVKTPRVGRTGDYYLSYRAGTDLDSNIGSTWKNKVSLHYYSGDNTEFITSLNAGESYEDTVNVFGVATVVMKITVVSIGGASVGAEVKVELFNYLPPDCEDVSIRMTDSYGDGWNGVNLYFTPDKASYVTLAAGSLGTTTVCLPPGTYSPFACDGSWHEEVGWSIVNYGVAGGASSSCTPTSGSFTVVANDFPSQSPSLAPTRNPTRSPTRPPTAAPTVSIAPTIAPSLAPTASPTAYMLCTTAIVSMFDSYGDGWNGNVLRLGSHSVTLASGRSGSSTICLEPGNYVPTCCGGAWVGEVSWTVKINDVLVSSGGASLSCSMMYTPFVVSETSLPPTAAPTVVLLISPTITPSSLPSFAPTSSPTMLPTGSPTIAPSALPSFAPTSSPTMLPTGSPTIAPSSLLSFAPTSSPSMLPTGSPTIAPSALPSFAPTSSPTMLPTGSPTIAPSSLLSFAPTSSSTILPTFASTVASSVALVNGSNVSTSVPLDLVVGCSAADFQQILDNQALILTALRKLVAYGYVRDSEGQVPENGRNDDSLPDIGASTASKGSGDSSQTNWTVTVIHVFAVIGAFATAMCAVAFVLHRVGFIYRQGSNNLPLTTLSCNQPKNPNLQESNEEYACADTAFDLSSA